MSDSNFDKGCPWCGENTMDRLASGMVECSNGCGFTDYLSSNKVTGLRHGPVILSVPVNFFKNPNPTAVKFMVETLLGKHKN